MRTVGYAYPWDFAGDPGAAERVASLGLDAVAVAASYHALRGASRWHPTRRVYEVPHSVLSVPVREDVWRDHALIPRAPDDGANGFALAQRALEDVGLTTDAWIVLNHVDDLAADDEFFARNAFGDVYRYALCPSHEEVREYGRTLIEEIITATDCAGVVLEALGPMGFTHHDAHDKTDLAGFSRDARELLSLCCCDTCGRNYAEAGIDTNELSARLRRGVDAASSVEVALGADLAAAVLSSRSAMVAAYLADVVTAIRALNRGTAISLHASALPLTTGSFTAVRDATHLEGVTTVADCWDRERAGAEVRALRELVGARATLGAYLRVDDLREHSGALVSAPPGLDELHLYHLGLVSRDDLDATREFVATSSLPMMR